MKIKKNGKVINLTEGDLQRIVKRTLNEETVEWDLTDEKSNGSELEDMKRRISILEKEIHGNKHGDSFGDKPLQEQIGWINSSIDELGKSISMIWKQLKK